MITYAAPTSAPAGESRMLAPLIQWLEARRWVREDSVVALEMPLSGRRVDLVVLTRSGALSAFELKLGGFSRVLEQAVYNRRSSTARGSS